jgi:hypothetical protein
LGASGRITHVGSWFGQSVTGQFNGDGGVRIVLSSSAAAPPEALAPLRHATVAAFHAAGGDPVCDDLALAVTGACANSVRHGAAHRWRRTYDRRCMDRGWAYRLQVRDHGRLLDAETHESREGLAVCLMQRVAETDMCSAQAVAPRYDSRFRCRDRGLRATRGDGFALRASGS